MWISSNCEPPSLPVCEPLIFAYHWQNSCKRSEVFPKLRQPMNNVGEGNYLDMNSDTSGYLHEMKLQTKENGFRGHETKHRGTHSHSKLHLKKEVESVALKRMSIRLGEFLARSLRFHGELPHPSRRGSSSGKTALVPPLFLTEVGGWGWGWWRWWVPMTSRWGNFVTCIRWTTKARGMGPFLCYLFRAAWTPQ